MASFPHLLRIKTYIDHIGPTEYGRATQIPKIHVVRVRRLSHLCQTSGLPSQTREFWHLWEELFESIDIFPSPPLDCWLEASAIETLLWNFGASDSKSLLSRTRWWLSVFNASEIVSGGFFFLSWQWIVRFRKKDPHRPQTQTKNSFSHFTHRCLWSYSWQWWWHFWSGDFCAIVKSTGSKRYDVRSDVCHWESDVTAEHWCPRVSQGEVESIPGVEQGAVRGVATFSACTRRGTTHTVNNIIKNNINNDEESALSQQHQESQVRGSVWCGLHQLGSR